MTKEKSIIMLLCGILGCICFGCGDRLMIYGDVTHMGSLYWLTSGTAQIPDSPFRLDFTNRLMSKSMIIWFVIVFIWEKDVLRKVNCCILSHKI